MKELKEYHFGLMTTVITDYVVMATDDEDAQEKFKAASASEGGLGTLPNSEIDRSYELLGARVGPLPDKETVRTLNGETVQ
jgi:hypothetical protein